LTVDSSRIRVGWPIKRDDEEEKIGYKIWCKGF
jgi:hypothetical protein